MLRGNAGSERRARRTEYVVVAVVAAMAFVLVAAVALVASASTDRARAAGAASSTAGPAEQDASIVAAWSRLRVGWIYVYADGRVVMRHDSGRMITDDGDIHYGIIQRHLSPVGVQLVRSGAVDFEQLMFERVDLEPGFWSPMGQSLYRPTSYALCLVNTEPFPPPSQLLLDVPDILDDLTDAAQDVLRDGVVQGFTDDFLDDDGTFAGLDGFHSAPGRGVDCLVLDAAHMLRLWAQTRLPLGDGDRGVLRLSDATFGVLTSPDGDREYLVAAIPILPHGGWVVWAG